MILYHAVIVTENRLSFVNWPPYPRKRLLNVWKFRVHVY